MTFFQFAGKMAIGSRLRLLTDTITRDAAEVFRLYNIDLQPKWFPVFHTLADGDQTVTAIASHIGHSHPSVSKTVREMTRKGIVVEKWDKSDKRKTVVGLTSKGKEMASRINVQYKDVSDAIDDILDQTQHDLWKAIEEWEFMLKEKSLLQRVQQIKKGRESKDVEVVPFEKKHAQAFKTLNEEWIKKHFKLEESDKRVLNNPVKEIISRGGYISVAMFNGEPVGVCALIKMDDPHYQYELAKMAVRPDMQGKNIGLLLGQSIVKKAKALGAKVIYLESNTVLAPAINLYGKLGFKKVKAHSSPYERCNIQMELKLR